MCPNRRAYELRRGDDGGLADRVGLAAFARRSHARSRHVEFARSGDVEFANPRTRLIDVAVVVERVRRNELAGARDPVPGGVRLGCILRPPLAVSELAARDDFVVALGDLCSEWGDDDE